MPDLGDTVRSTGPEAHLEPRIALVVVCAGGDSCDLKRLLASLGTSDHQNGRLSASISVLVVENTPSPHDAAIRRLLDETNNVRHLKPGRNIGYGPAINFAVRDLCRQGMPNLPDWIVACNADLEFPAGSLSELAEVLGRRRSEPIAVIAPQLLDPVESGGGLQPVIGRFPTLLRLLAGKLKSRRRRKYERSPGTSSAIEWATGACLAIRTSSFISVGGFDPEFFLDYEDIDLCRRLHDDGWQCSMEPSWRVVHIHPTANEPRPNPDRQIFTRRSLMRYLARHRPRWEFRMMGMLMCWTTRLRSRHHPLHRSWQAGAEAYRELQQNPAQSMDPMNVTARALIELQTDLHELTESNIVPLAADAVVGAGR